MEKLSTGSGGGADSSPTFAMQPASVGAAMNSNVVLPMPTAAGWDEYGTGFGESWCMSSGPTPRSKQFTSHERFLASGESSRNGGNGQLKVLDPKLERWSGSFTASTDVVPMLALP